MPSEPLPDSVRPFPVGLEFVFPPVVVETGFSVVTGLLVVTVVSEVLLLAVVEEADAEEETEEALPVAGVLLSCPMSELS